MGGSITDTTQARLRYTPRTQKPCNQAGACKAVNKPVSRSSIQNSPSARTADGILAPDRVTQKTTASNPNIKGNPQTGEVMTLSIFRSQLARPGEE